MTLLVKDVLFTPIRLCQIATHFYFDLQTNRYCPCSPSYEQAVEISLKDLPRGQVKLPQIEMKHFIDALERVKSSVQQQDLFQYEQWTQQFGSS